MLYEVTAFMFSQEKYIEKYVIYDLEEMYFDNKVYNWMDGFLYPYFHL